MLATALALLLLLVRCRRIRLKLNNILVLFLTQLAHNSLRRVHELLVRRDLLVLFGPACTYTVPVALLRELPKLPEVFHVARR